MNRTYMLMLILFISNGVQSAELESNHLRFSEILSAIKLEQGYPGISLAIYSVDEIYTNQIGYADIAEARPVDSETIFRVYSVTKGLTEILTRVLVRNGTLDLDLPIKSYMPNIPLHLTEVTSQHLLSHTSGIRHYRSNDEWLLLSKKHCSSPSDSFDSFLNDPLVSAVGVKESYTSFGYVLLSGVLEAAAGDSFGDLMNEHVIEPSGAERIELDNPGENANENVTKFYEPLNGGYLEAPRVDNSCKFGGGAVNSTPTEIAKIFSYYFSGKLTGQTSFQVSSSLPDRISFSGEGLGGRSVLTAFPKDKLAIVLVANARGGNLQPFSDEIAELILTAKNKR